LTLLLLGKARKRSLLSLNRKVVNSELFPSPPHSFQRLLFAPAAGYRRFDSGVLGGASIAGFAWASSSCISDTRSAGGGLYFEDGDVRPLHAAYSSFGRPVRCVQASAEVACFSRSSCRRRPLPACGCVVPFGKKTGQQKTAPASTGAV